MSKFTVTIDFDYIPEIIAKVESASRAAPKKVADRMATTARRLVPKDTWALHDSIVTQVVRYGKESEILVLAPYAAYVEYGTYKMSAQPYLGPAIEAHAEELEAEIVGALVGW